MYFNVFFKLIKVHLLVSELSISVFPNCESPGPEAGMLPNNPQILHIALLN